ncbi:MAG TPA: MlaD family protein [Candidatus Binatia bacterium]|jgi:paraquat-inducible protein B|nr:MlaD family protein [Candidatus Binatia bacterium]
MSKQASPTAIGGFVVGAVALVVAGVLIFGSGKFFSHASPAVMYFEGNVQGLQVGAAVKFRGVPIGAVTDIKAKFDTRELKFRIPVFVKFTQDRIEREGVGAKPQQEILNALVEQGLRAQLQPESIVTGQLFVQLDFYPDAPPKQVTIDPATQLIEIPTIPTAFELVSQTLRTAINKIAQFPIEQIVANLEEALSNINRVVNAPEVLETVRTLNSTLLGVRQLVQRTDKQLEPLTSGIAKTVENVNKLTQSVDGQLASLTASLKDTSEAARGALEQTRETMAAVQGFTAPSSPVQYELAKTLKELSETARSLRMLVDYLERHPNAVVFGRGRNEAGEQ